MVIPVGLPLLIVNGKFRSLGSMSTEDLATFIPYLAKCSINRAGARLINGIPEWWCSAIQFKFPLKKPKGLSEIGYRRHLSSLVYQCYWYHKAQYVLPFCAAIATHPESVFFKSNEDDNTTSIFYTKNMMHIMKFINENKTYDEQPKKQEKTQRRCLLSALPKKATAIPDIYLCENCDAEFSSYSEMVMHEKTCYELIICSSDHEDVSEGGEKIEDSSEEIEILEHIKPGDSCLLSEKRNFLGYLNLGPNGSQNSELVPRSKKNAAEINSRRRLLEEANYYKNHKIEFSSLYGRKILGFRVSYDLRTKIQKSLMFNESYCCVSVRPNRETRDCLGPEFKVTWSRKMKKEKWSHEYCFNQRQRRSRYKTLKTGLNERSRKLLKQCKELRVVLYRLKPKS